MNGKSENDPKAPAAGQSKQTPGPWEVYDRIHIGSVSAADGHVATVEMEGDAPPIALAPTIADRAADLIDACPGACGCTAREQDSGHRVDCWRPRLDRAVDALADALRAAGRLP